MKEWIEIIFGILVAFGIIRYLRDPAPDTQQKQFVLLCVFTLLLPPLLYTLMGAFQAKFGHERNMFYLSGIWVLLGSLGCWHLVPRVVFFPVVIGLALSMLYVGLSTNRAEISQLIVEKEKFLLARHFQKSQVIITYKNYRHVLVDYYNAHELGGKPVTLVPYEMEREKLSGLHVAGTNSDDLIVIRDDSGGWEWIIEELGSRPDSYKERSTFCIHPRGPMSRLLNWFEKKRRTICAHLFQARSAESKLRELKVHS